MRYLVLSLFFGAFVFAGPALLPLCGQSYTQKADHLDDPSIFGKNNIAVSILPIIHSGYQIEYDRKIFHHHWIKVAPILLFRQDYTFSDPYDIKTLKGYGAKLQHKYIPYLDHRHKYNLYIAYGGSFQVMECVTKNETAIDLKKFSLDCQLGFHKIFAGVFFFDIYAGIGTQFRQSKQAGSAVDRFYKNHQSLWFDFGQNGHYFSFGLNIGVLF